MAVAAAVETPTAPPLRLMAVRVVAARVGLTPREMELPTSVVVAAVQTGAPPAREVAAVDPALSLSAMQRRRAAPVRPSRRSTPQGASLIALLPSSQPAHALGRCLRESPLLITPLSVVAVAAVAATVVVAALVASSRGRP
jgi:hypothetical protein